jgi:hypothetical protein
VGVIWVWSNQAAVTKSVMDTLALFDQTLITTQDGLTIVSQGVQTTSVDVASLKTTTLALAQTIHGTNPMIDSLTKLTSQDFPAAIVATQTSLAAAQSSALLIDNLLATLTSLPFIQLPAYNPDVPLHTSLAQVSTSLDSLTPALTAITSSLVGGKANLSIVEVELNKISETTQTISTSFDSAQTAIDQYKTVTVQLKAQVEAAQLAVPGGSTCCGGIPR